MKKQGFISTFIAVSSGTSIFPKIAKFALWRMLLHLTLLAICCGFVNVAFRYHPFNAGYEESCKKLQKKFGDLKYSSKGITPSINPNQRGTVYFDTFRVDYFPELDEVKKLKPDKDTPFGIAWTPDSAILWVLHDKEPSPFMPLLIPTIIKDDEQDKGMSFLLKKMKMRMQGEIDNTLSLYDVSKIYKIPPGQFSTRQVSFREFQTNILGIPCKIPTLYVLFLIGEILINCLIFSPMYILIFTLFSFLLGKSNMLSLKFSKLFIVGIYTGFPGIVIATLYTALDLPYLDFQNVFLLSYIIYSFPVFTRLRLAELEQQKQQKNTPNDK